MEKYEFDLVYCTRPGQRVMVFFDFDDPSGSGVDSDGRYSCGLWAQVRNQDKYELIGVSIKSDCLNDDLGAILFPRSLYTENSQSIDAVLPFIIKINDTTYSEEAFFPQSNADMIKYFQRMHGLDPDGKIGPQTKEAIVQILVKDFPLYSGEDPTGTY